MQASNCNSASALITFMLLPGQSQVIVAMPSASFVMLKSVIFCPLHPFNDCRGTHARRNTQRGQPRALAGAL